MDASTGLKLDSLGAQIVFLKMSAEDILQRTIRARKHTDFFDYIQKFGSTEDQLVEYFRREQERMEDILRDVSCLPITSVEERHRIGEVLRDIAGAFELCLSICGESTLFWGSADVGRVGVARRVWRCVECYQLKKVDSTA